MGRIALEESSWMIHDAFMNSRNLSLSGVVRSLSLVSFAKSCGHLEVRVSFFKSISQLINAKQCAT